MAATSTARLLATLLVVFSGCAHEVVHLDENQLPIEPLPVPIGLTVAVVAGSFDRSRINPAGVSEVFARELEEARLFQGVMFPVPPGADPTWELELAGSDRAFEPGSNRWKSFLVTLLPPLGFVIWLENDYTLELQALLLKNRELIRSYTATASIRHRYQYSANRMKMEVAGVETVVGGATRSILDAIARDAVRLERLNDIGP